MHALQETLTTKQQCECMSNEQFFNKLIHDITHAQSHVFLSTFSWDSGILSETIIKAIADLRNRRPQLPVSVSINRWYPHLKQHDWTPFPWRAEVDAAYRQFQYEMHTLQNDLGVAIQWPILNHEKCYVVDDTMYITDANIGDQHNTGQPILENHDHAWPGLTIKIHNAVTVDTYLNGSSRLSMLTGAEIIKQKAFGPRHIYKSLQESLALPDCDSIILISPYPGGAYFQLLAEASYSGIRTSLIQPSPDARNRRPLSEHVSRFQINDPHIEMLSAGVAIGFSPTMFHGKVVIVGNKQGDEELFIGSDNFDSNMRFHEVACKTKDQTIIAQAHQLFIDPLMQHALPFEDYYG
ncbi:phosphatidylserine/phosphatidylglycerophosphate/cardiolipin synthase family protein [Candidatus Roizmanbacteria bacterium]|nr:phosphatidylserine/phosphatidylglycerophosphate/cardiolipin synthase family protein [Candidatus Roizmanbacteria bacterium]